MDGVPRRLAVASGPVRCVLAVLCLAGGLGWLVRPAPAGAAAQGRVRLVRQTPWVAPGETMSLALRATDIADPAALELAVTVHPAVKNRAELARTTTGEGLAAPIGPRSSAAVPLPQVPTSLDGTLSVQVPTQDPAAPPDATRVRLRSRGIYPVQVELRELGGGETVDRFTTYLLAVGPPGDGARLGAAVVLELSAPPSSDLDGVAAGPPAGATALADTAAGLLAAPRVPLTLAPTPEVLSSLLASEPGTATALRQALVDRDVLARPYVPVDVPGLGAAAGALVPQELATGREVTRSVLGRDPISGVWLADEPLDGPALGQVMAAGSDRVVLPQAALGPTGPAVPAPLRPVPVVGGGAGRSATALVADATLSSRLDGQAAPLDQPLVAHQLLADLAAVATLPAEQTAPAPPGGAGRVATVLAGRRFLPTSDFLTELLGGLSTSPVLRAVDLPTAFSVPPEPPPPATTKGQRGTTTTVPATAGRRLLPLPADAAGRGIGDVAAEAIWQLSTASQVLVAPPPAEPLDPGRRADDPGRRLLVAPSADLPVEQRRARLRALGERTKADLAKLKMPTGRTLRLTARTGKLPVGIFNDTGHAAHVLLQLDSEKLEFPDGNRDQVVLDRGPTTRPIRVRVRASGSFRVKVRLLTPDGSRVLQETEYVVRANTLPGVAIAVSGAAAVFLAGWWAKTLLPERRHLRRRSGRQARPAG